MAGLVVNREEAFSMALIGLILFYVRAATGRPMFDILFDHLPDLLP